MRVHYSFTPYRRYTACGLHTGPYPVTHNRDEVTCGSCKRCFAKYTRLYQETIEKTNHLSNEELLNKVMENLDPAPYYAASEFAELMQVLLSRLTESGFISGPNKIWTGLYYL